MPRHTFKLGDIVQYVHPVWSPLSPNPPALHAVGKVIFMVSSDAGRSLRVRWGRDSADNENISDVSEGHVALLVEGDEEEEKHIQDRDAVRELVDRLGVDLFRQLAAPYLEQADSEPAPAPSGRLKKSSGISDRILMAFRDDAD